MVILGSQEEGRIPGYQGYIPGMKNHLFGKRYSEATRKAEDCAAVLRNAGNPSSLQTLVDDRPQGRNFLYAQVAQQGPPQDPVLAPAHVGKRMPLLDDSLGEIDFRKMKTVIGNKPHEMKTIKSASLPALPYRAKKFFTGREVPDAPPLTEGNLPGYTGHQHGAQHVYAKSYGSTTKALNEDVLGGGSVELSPTKNVTMERSHKFLHYGEGRPVGDCLTEKHRIPGYQGYIPSKDNHIYGKTYGEATNLAPLAEGIMGQGGNASAIKDLVDMRPQGPVDLYAQSFDINPPTEKKPLPVHVSKGVVRTVFVEQGKDYKYREKISEDIKVVKKAEHRVVGYTGHVHGQQHVYSQSFGKMTRALKDSKASTTDQLLYFADERPNQLEG